MKNSYTGESGIVSMRDIQHAEDVARVNAMRDRLRAERIAREDAHRHATLASDLKSLAVENMRGGM